MLYLAFLKTWDQPFDPAAHKTNAFFCMKGSVDESEDGDVIVPTFHVTIENPGVAWLASQPSRYAVLSEMTGDDIAPIQIARGRLSTLPSELAGDDCELEFICVPPNEDQVLKAAANLLRIGEVAYDPDAPLASREAAERYDPLFFSPEAVDDPTNVLSGTLEAWRWNRLTLVPERVHLINGQVQHIIAGPTAGTAGSEKMSLSNPPRAMSHIRLIGHWTQSAVGDQDSEFMGTVPVDTYNYQSFIDGLPKPGTAIGTSVGWTIADAQIKGVEDLLPQTFGRQFPSIWGATNQQITMQPKRVTIGMRAHYEYSQEREETIDIYMSAGVQPVLDDDKVETVEQISLASLTMDVTTQDWRYEHPDTLVRQHYLVGDRVQANGFVWVCMYEHDATETFSMNLFDPDTGDIVQNLWQKTAKQAALDSQSPRFADTSRGSRAIRHAIRRLERIVQKRARAAVVSFEVPFRVARLITCADECRVANDRFPGGEIVGKVIGVSLSIDGAKRSATITLGVSVGTGVNPGNGITGEDYIPYGLNAPAANVPVNTYGLSGQAPRILQIENQADLQNGFARNASESGGDPVAAIGANPTIIRIYFEPLRQEDSIQRRISVQTQPIYVRKGIDLSPEIT